MIAAIRNFLAEPRPSNPPGNRWWDYLFIALIAIGSILEAILSSDIQWRPVTPVFALAMAALLLLRRQRPLLVIVLAAAMWMVLDATDLVFGEQSIGVGGAPFATMVLIYAVARWATGREVAIGLVLTIVGYAVGEIGNDELTWIESTINVVVWLFPSALGIGVRYRANLHLQVLEDVRINERQQLARELHDMVAHYVSAIAIQAQAGQAVADTRPEKAAETLHVIEQTASTTLTEMRRMVGVLRNPDNTMETTPQAGLAEIRQLGDTTTGGLPVDVTMSGTLDNLPAPVAAGLFRLAQEAVTNARRHARHATRIAINIVGEAERVWLTVIDDGDSPSASRSSAGYGLVGMTERALVLGGTLRAEPAPHRGWIVEACLPIDGANA